MRRPNAPCVSIDQFTFGNTSCRVFGKLNAFIPVTASDPDPTWQALQKHYDQLEGFDCRQAFTNNPQRAEQFTFAHDGLLFDFSKNWLTAESLEHWQAHAHAQDFSKWRDALFGSGDWAMLNNTEQRAALHTALRGKNNHDAHYTDNICQTVTQQETAAQQAVLDIQSGQWQSASQQPFTDVIHLGTGGSHLGPELFIQALPQAADGLSVHFLPNLDAHSVNAVLDKINPETTLVVLASKSFGTQEALLNFAVLKEHFVQTVSEHDFFQHQVLAITANPERAKQAGIPAKNCLTFSDWVGGRYSIWSAIGVTVALYAGHDALEACRAGAASMDAHFLNTNLTQNIPFIAASVACGYRNFADLTTQAVMVYADRLSLLPSYLQQLDMESNGKSVQRDGTPVNSKTGTVLWGGVGTNAQHAVMQLVHQGSDVIPTEFIGLLPQSNEPSHRNLEEALLANLLAQSSALLKGQATPDSPHKVMQGNRPSTIIFLDNITPETLGALLAFYEHKIFCQAVLWGINPFDQWGVELGKTIAGDVLAALQLATQSSTLDASTRYLLQHIAKH